MKSRPFILLQPIRVRDELFLLQQAYNIPGNFTVFLNRGTSLQRRSCSIKFDIIPGKIDLVRLEARSCAFWEQVMVIVPFAGYKARPYLVYRHIVAVIICSFPPFIFSFTVAFVIKGAYTNGPNTRRSEKRANQCRTPDQVPYRKPETPGGSI